MSITSTLGLQRSLPLLLASSLLLALGVTVATPAPAEAAKCGSRTSGVTVVVDFSAFDKPVRVRCASGDPASGLAALRRANFSYDFMPGYPGWVCRINDKPRRCNASSDRYWSYWHARRGGEWQYSTVGAGDYDPRPGTVEGWAFGRGNPPKVSPPR